MFVPPQLQNVLLSGMQADPVGQSAVVLHCGGVQRPLSGGMTHVTLPSAVVAQEQPEGHPAAASPWHMPPVGQVRPQAPFTQGWPLGQLPVQVPLTQQAPPVQQVPPHSRLPLAAQTPPHRAVPAGQAQVPLWQVMPP